MILHSYPDNKDTYMGEINSFEVESSYVQDTDLKINKKENKKQYLNIIQISPSSSSISPTKVNQAEELEVTEFRRPHNNKTQLDYILTEIITTEEQYVKNLRFLISSFLESLSREPIFNFLKYYLKNLLDIHSTLLAKIKNVYIESFYTSIVKVDIITQVVVKSVSIYFYENYIKIYYIISKILREKKTKLARIIINLNNAIHSTKYTDSEQRHHNMSFESLLQAPLNRIITYKIFFSRVLLNNVTSSFYKHTMANHVNDLLKKIEKIDNFELDYATTIRTKNNYNIIDESGRGALNKPFNPNFRYNNVIQKIIQNDDSIALLTFGPIILFQPVIVYYIQNKSKKKTNSRYKNLISKLVPNTKEVSPFQVEYKDNCIALLFKSHLLILGPLNNSYNGLKIIFCTPLAITEVPNIFNNGIMTNFKNTLKLICGYKLTRFEMLITCWNNIEFENFNSKLCYLSHFYNSNGKRSTNQDNEDSLSMESLKNIKLSNANCFNHALNQIIKPNNIAIKEFDLAYINKDNSFGKSYFNQAFLINVNCSNYLEYENDDVWIWHELNTQISENSKNTDILINVNSRIILEDFLSQNNMWFSDVDMLKLTQFKQQSFSISSSEIRKSSSVKNLFTRVFNLARNSSVKSSTTISDKSILFLPRNTVLNNVDQLRTSLIINSENLNGCSYFSSPIRSVKRINSKRAWRASDKSYKTVLTKEITMHSSSATSADNKKYLPVLAMRILEDDEHRNQDVDKGHTQSDDTILNKSKYTKSMEKLVLLKEHDFSFKAKVPNVDQIIELYVDGKQQSRQHYLCEIKT